MNHFRLWLLFYDVILQLTCFQKTSFLLHSETLLLEGNWLSGAIPQELGNLYQASTYDSFPGFLARFYFPSFEKFPHDIHFLPQYSLVIKQQIKWDFERIIFPAVLQWSCVS